MVHLVIVRVLQTKARRNWQDDDDEERTRGEKREKLLALLYSALCSRAFGFFTPREGVPLFFFFLLKKTTKKKNTRTIFSLLL